MKLSKIMQTVLKTVLKHEVFFIILFFLIILRIPNLFEPYWYGDEGIYLILGQALNKGLVLYKNIIDHKTPLIYYLASVPSQFWFKFLLLAWQLVTTTFFYIISRKFLKSNIATYISTAAFMLFTTLPAFEGNIANGELFVMGFTLAGLYFFTKTTLFQAFLEKKDVFPTQPLLFVIAGIFLALGALTKVPAIFDAAAIYSIFLFILVRNPSIASFKKLFVSAVFITIGFAIPILISILFFFSKGALNEYAQFGLLYNFRYSNEFSFPFSLPPIVFLYSMIGKVLVTAAGLITLLLFQKKFKPTFQFVFMWSLFALFSTLLSSRPYPHYWLQVGPPFALLLGMVFTKTKRIEKILAALPFLILVETLVLFKVGLYQTFPYYRNFIQFVTKNISLNEYRKRFDPLMPDTYTVAEYIKKTTQKNDRIFIWGTDPMLYALSERLPTGRFTVSFHIKDFHAYDETFASIVQTEPPIIVVMRDEKGAFDVLSAYIAKNYVLVERYPTMSVYRSVKSL